MSELSIPNLTFSNITLSRTGATWGLLPLLYRGGAAAEIRRAPRLIEEGLLGTPIPDRLPLVIKLHEAIDGELAGGGSRYSARVSIANLKYFFAWADEVDRALTLATVAQCYVEWTDQLLHRQRIIGDLRPVTVYGRACNIASLLDRALDLTGGLLRKTRIKNKPVRKRVLGTAADKQNLADTFMFGSALLDISDALTVDAVRGPLPVKIHFRNGQVIEEWAGLVAPDKVRTLSDGAFSASRRRHVLARRAAWEADTSLRTRYPLTNLRIEAELLIFIAQTSMNLSQAYKLKTGRFSYRSHLDGYQVRRVYKGRRQGEVEFEIYSEYRVVFDRYLQWRNSLFPDDEDGLLFPLASPQHRAPEVAPTLGAIRRRCLRLDIPYIGPQVLRSTRINWLIRRSRDSALTAEMAQHTEETLLSAYVTPHHQAAIVEISRFHARNDPAISPPGPGTCVEASPEVMDDVPTDAPRPDCVSPAGCLFCTHHRDLDTADHTWSLASYRHYKSLELASYRPLSRSDIAHPAATVIDRLTAKLKFFEASSEIRSLWVGEALARVEEGEYHPKWDGFIRLMEVRA